MSGQFRTTITAVTVSIILAACGGGGGSGPAGAGNPAGAADASSPGNTGTGASSAAPAFVYDETARFNTPMGVKSNAAGNLLVLDMGNDAIRRIAPNGSVSTLARGLPFRAPGGIDVDGAGNVYLTSGGQVGEIYKITPDGVRTTLAAVPFSNNPAVDAQGVLYVTSASDTGNATAIRRITPEGQVSLVYTGARGVVHAGLAVDPAGNLYTIIRDDFRSAQGRVVRITPAGVSSDVAAIDLRIVPSDATITEFIVVANITFDTAGNLYVAHHRDHTGSPGGCLDPTPGFECGFHQSGMSITKVTPAGVVSRLRTGTPSNPGGDYARHWEDAAYRISYIGAGRDGNIYATYKSNHTVYRISQAGAATLFAGKPGEPGNAD